MAVDKGFADKNPNNLENFVGDYVFNPLGNQSQIKISEPVQVREIGTGFMMVQKHAFERIRDAYPQLSYKPDHVRTEHFDGSREIHAYFDCVIDRNYTFDDAHRLIEDIASGNASKRYLSEDYMFCYFAQRIGLKVWFCPWMKLQHVGTYVFGGSLADLAAVGAPATADAGALRNFRNADKQNDQKAVAKAQDKRNKRNKKRAKQSA
jgi:hypothetical protein